MELTPEIDAVLRGERAWGFQAGHCLDSLRALPDGCVHCVVTSPPYYALRSYLPNGHEDKAKEIGLEETPAAYVAKMVEVFAEVRRVLHPSGCLFLNIGDSYASTPPGTKRPGASASSTLHGIESETYRATLDAGTGTKRDTSRLPGVKPKDLLGIPWMLAFALRDAGWYLRSDIPWVKRSPMPESVTDRPTKALEYVFLLTKSERYYFDMEAVKSKSVCAGERREFGNKNAEARLVGQLTGNMTPGVKITVPDGRNFRNADLWFQSVESPFGLVGVGDELVGLDVTSEPLSDAHFAAFPSALVRPFVLAGSSERGVCPSCYAPWRRIVERSKVKRHRPNDYVKREGQDGTGNSCANTVAGTRSVTKGWEPSCRCGHEPVPALVLDPFSGAGTTVKMAHELGRRAIGLELNESYIAMARRRIANASLVKDESIPADPLPLFAAGF